MPWFNLIVFNSESIQDAMAALSTPSATRPDPIPPYTVNKAYVVLNQDWVGPGSAGSNGTTLVTQANLCIVANNWAPGPVKPFGAFNANDWGEITGSDITTSFDPAGVTGPAIPWRFCADDSTDERCFPVWVCTSLTE